MITLKLDKNWTLTSCGYENLSAEVPCSMYSVLLNHDLIEDPFYRDNENKYFPLSENDSDFFCNFDVDEEILSKDKVFLCFKGIDTIADIFLNDTKIGYTNNMYRTWEYDVKGLLKKGSNTLKVHIYSPLKYIKEKQSNIYVGGIAEGTAGYPHLRKAHCMFGWDWGPRLPDEGIWKDVMLFGVDVARITDVHIRQNHFDGKVKLNFNVDTEKYRNTDVEYDIVLTSPDGKETVISDSPTEHVIEKPALWWPKGYGEQNLYKVSVVLKHDGEIIDSYNCRIGLRTMTVSRNKHKEYETFAHCVNGVDIFAMGADYIPEDNILARCTPERTRKLLEDAALANHNSVRVWGGGYYPDDDFYDICDELGLIVWQDFMFACANYELDDEFEENLKAEFIENIKRIRKHPSLGLWCGNNEMEGFYSGGNWCGLTPKQRSDYIKIFEYIIPKLVKQYDPDTFYWPSSPSSGGNFDDPGCPSKGDVHYWEVWHGNKPFTDYRNYLFAYVSEFGFQSFPSYKTVESFTENEDRNIFSYVMEKHQRNFAANGKILNYLQQTYLYPSDFDTLLYTSQLLSAEAIKYGVEHWRRYRGRCMGALVWQLNDCWPVASWASIDYYGRWKALHYFEKRFFAPIMISCCEEGMISQNPNPNAEPYELKKSIRLSVANETMHDITTKVRWQLRKNNSDILKDGGEVEVKIPALTSTWLDEVNLPEADPFEDYVYYECEHNGKVISSGTVIFSMPKYFRFINPHITAKIEGDEVVVTADSYARCVELLNENEDWVLEDNYFDMNKGEKRIKILRGNAKKVKVRSVYDIR